MLHYTRLERLARDKHSIFLGPFVSCKIVNAAPNSVLLNILVTLEQPASVTKFVKMNLTNLVTPQAFVQQTGLCDLAIDI
jgi:hypothetical protein